MELIKLCHRVMVRFPKALFPEHGEVSLEEPLLEFGVSKNSSVMLCRWNCCSTALVLKNNVLCSLYEKTLIDENTKHQRMCDTAASVLVGYGQAL